MEVILDTNVVVSLLLTQNSVIKRINTAIRNGHVNLVVSNPLRAEYHEVLTRPRLQRMMPNSSDVPTYLQLIERISRKVDVSSPYPKAPDPADVFLLAMIESTQVDCLVTGDKHLLELAEYDGTPLRSMRQFVNLLDAQRSGK